MTFITDNTINTVVTPTYEQPERTSKLPKKNKWTRQDLSTFVFEPEIRIARTVFAPNVRAANIK